MLTSIAARCGGAGRSPASRGRRLLSISFLSLFLLPSAAILPPGMPLGDPVCRASMFATGTAQLAQDPAVIPFRLDGHKIMVAVTINDSPPPAQLVLDTGGLTMVDDAVAARLGLEEGAPVPTMGSMGRSWMAKKAVTLELGPARIEDFRLPVLTFDFVEETGRSIDGLLGADFLRHFTVEIDYARERLYLTQRALADLCIAPPADPAAPFAWTATAPEAARVSFKPYFPIGAPLVDCIVNGDEVVSGMIDTGADTPLVFPLAMATQGAIVDSSALIASDGVIAEWPLGTLERNYLARLPSFTFGDRTVERMPALFANVMCVLLGKRMLDPFRIALDFPNREAVIVPRPEAEIDTRLVASGFAWERDAEGKVRVRGVWQGSPAAQAGLRPGDELVRLNGRVLDELETQSLYAFLHGALQDDGPERIELVVRRGTDPRETLELTVHKAELMPYPPAHGG